MLLVGLVLVTALALDLLQYGWATGAWGVFHRSAEKEHNEPDEVLAPAWINYPTLFFFWTKLGAVAIAYVLLGLALKSRLH